MVQARIDSQRTSQSVSGLGGSTIYSREPNRKNAVFIGNLTWVSGTLNVLLLSTCTCTCIHALHVHCKYDNLQNQKIH